jgi:hypothetical protein
LFGGLFIRIACVISENFICSFVYIKGYFAKKEVTIGIEASTSIAMENESKTL